MNNAKITKTVLLLLGCWFLLFTSGCDTRNERTLSSPLPVQTPQVVMTPLATPSAVEAFKQKAASFYNKSVFYTFNGTPKYLKIATVQYDIRKTDSMVSPLVGIVELTADAMDYNYLYRLNYAFQNGVWTYKTTNLTLTERKLGISQTSQLKTFNPEDADFVK